MLGSGSPSGVVLPVLYLSPFRLSMRIDVKGFQEVLPHSGEGQPVKPGIVGDEADDALPCLLDDAPLRHAEEPHVEIVQPLSLGLTHSLGGPDKPFESSRSSSTAMPAKPL